MTPERTSSPVAAPSALYDTSAQSLVSPSASASASASRQPPASFDSVDTNIDDAPPVQTPHFSLKSQPSFKHDEGYSEDAVSVDESSRFESSGHFSTATEEDTQPDDLTFPGENVDVPAWMMNLNDAQREGMQCLLPLMSSLA